MTTPIRKGLRAESWLLPLVKNGLQAIERAHHQHIEERARGELADSLDIDKAFQRGHETESRWDNLLGVKATRKIIALEPHTASNKELSSVIRKRAASIEHLRGHLRPGIHVSDWFLVASGRVDFLPLEKAKVRLDQNGIRFVGKTLLVKMLSS